MVTEEWNPDEFPLFAATRPKEEAKPLSVAQLTLRIKDLLQSRFSRVWITGEISNLSRPRSGHIYLTLKDDEAQIRAVIWRGTASRIDYELEDGLEVLCSGSIDVYPPHGSYQLIIRELEPLGAGALQIALKRLRDRLAKEGLFDAERKRPLPSFPQFVAVVTSPTGAAVRDFLEVAKRRWRGVRLLLVPTQVQGDAAVPQIVAALDLVNRLRETPQAVVLTRGGGSIEDLWCFNDERVVRAVAASGIPVVSAIGHEIDITLSDLAADVRALTPTEAAELVIPSAESVRQGLEKTSARLVDLLRGRIERARERVTGIENRRVLQRPRDRIRDLSRAVDDLEMRAVRAIRVILDRAKERVAGRAGKLETLSPLGVIDRGYSITSRLVDGMLVRTAEDVNVGDQLRTQLGTGELVSRVEAKTEQHTDQRHEDATRSNKNE